MTDRHTLSNVAENRFVLNLNNLSGSVGPDDIQNIGRSVQNMSADLQSRLHMYQQQAMNAAVNNMGSNRAMTYSQPHSHSSNNDAAANNVIIDMESGGPSIAGSQQHVPLGGGGRTQETSNIPTGGATAGGDSGSHIHQIGARMLMSWLQGSLPFFILLLAKVFYDHRLGFLVFAGLFGTFYHANNAIKRHIGRETSRYQDDQPRPKVQSLIWIILFLLCNILFIYYVFSDQQLYRCLYFCQPVVAVKDVWSLCWTVGITDFVIKFTVVIIKALVAMLPNTCISPKKKGTYYMLVEQVSQLYRYLIPIMPWVHFLIEDDAGTSSPRWFSYFLVLLYFLCKSQHVYRKLKEVYKAYRRFKSHSNQGSAPSSEDLKAADNTCPICQDRFKDPIKLSCKHIFCEDCVSIWFNRERTCPMCRAMIADNPVWRDGATSAAVQIY